jgi:hypothetical protein
LAARRPEWRSRLRLPDFIIAGAPRSGTTWLYELLARHPDIYMAPPRTPEPKFFLVDDLYAQGLERYAEWFKGAAAHQLAGEKSTNYLENAPSADRIARDLPGVKLVFILREPAARAYSNYLWSKMNGLEDLSFADALDREDERERNVLPRLRFARPHAYFSRGLYADHLTRYFDRFPRENILLVKFEHILDCPAQLAEQLHRFLGVDVRRQDANALGPINESEKPDAHMPDEAAARLRERYAEPNRRLAALLGPEFDIWT